MKFTYTLLLVVCVALSSASMAQHAANAAESHHSMQGTHRLTLGLGHTHISQGKIEGDTKWLATASWSLNYDYWVSKKWAIGLQNDIILESFVIEHGDEELLERKYPVAIVPVAIYKPGKNLSLIGGVGAEISHGHTLTLTRLGVEYGWHLPKNWEVGIAMVWDGKWKYYNSWGLAFTFSRLWPSKHH
jgi:hypothetical protein